MTFFDKLAGWLSAIWYFIVRPRQSAFACGDCAKRDRCGLPPSDQCVTRAAQLDEEYRWGLRV